VFNGVPVPGHPAEKELFGAALTCEVRVPAVFVPGERALQQQQSESLLHGLAVAEDSRSEDPDDHGEVPQSMQRLEAKLDLVLSLLGKLARQRNEATPVRSMRWSHLGLRLDLHETPDVRPGDAGVVLLQPAAWFSDHIELPATVLACGASGDGIHHLWLRFGRLSAGLQDALERHLFRLHRRQIAEARQHALDHDRL